MMEPRPVRRRAGVDLRPHGTEKLLVFEKADLEADHVATETAGCVGKQAQSLERPRDRCIEGGPFDARLAGLSGCEMAGRGSAGRATE